MDDKAMKDWNTCLDEVAMKHGHRDWTIAKYRNNRESIDKLEKEAAELYAKEVALEAVKLARIKETLYVEERFAGVQEKYTEQEILEKLKL